MSGGAVCRCPEASAPLAGRLWRVVMRRAHASAFAGYRVTASAYSEVKCLRCCARWRTAAAYVDGLPDWSFDEEADVEAAAAAERRRDEVVN